MIDRIKSHAKRFKKKPINNILGPGRALVICESKIIFVRFMSWVEFLAALRLKVLPPTSTYLLKRFNNLQSITLSPPATSRPAKIRPPIRSLS